MASRTAEHVLTPIPRPGMIRPETVMSNESYASDYYPPTAYSESSTRYVRQASPHPDPDPPYRPAAAAPQTRPNESFTHNRAPSKTMTFHPPDSPPPMSKEFGQKLRALLRDDGLEKYIYWNPDGKSFRLRNHPNFTDKLYSMFAVGNTFTPISAQLQQNGFQVMIVETRNSGTTGRLYEVYDCRRPDFTQDIRNNDSDLPITSTMGKLSVAPTGKGSELPPYPKTEPSRLARPKETTSRSTPQSFPENKLEIVARTLLQRNQDMSELLEERENDYRILFNSVQDYMRTQSTQSQQAFLEILRRNKEYHGYVHPLHRSTSPDDGDGDLYDDVMA